MEHEVVVMLFVGVGLIILARFLRSGASPRLAHAPTGRSVGAPSMPDTEVRADGDPG
jgi:hypothetical protein